MARLRKKQLLFTKTELSFVLTHCRFDPRARNIHECTQFQTPGRFMLIPSGSFVLPPGSSVGHFTADGVGVQWSVPLMHMVAPVVRLVRKGMWVGREIEEIAARLFPSRHPATPESAALVKTIKGVMTNIRIDVPFCLQLKDGKADAESLLLQTYRGEKADMVFDVGGRRKWDVSLHNSTVFKEGEAFLSLEDVRMNGAEIGRAENEPKSFNLTGNRVRGEWEPGLQLGLFKIVKDIVASVVNMKADLWFETDCWGPHAVEDEPAHSSAAAAKCKSAPLTDQDLSDPFIQLLHSGGKHLYVEAFKRWCNVLRARYLPEPFMRVDMAITDLYIRASLANPTESSTNLDFDIKLGLFAGSTLPHDWTFKKVSVDFAHNPLLSVDKLKVHRIGMGHRALCYLSAQLFHAHWHCMLSQVSMTNLWTAPSRKKTTFWLSTLTYRSRPLESGSKLLRSSRWARRWIKSTSRCSGPCRPCWHCPHWTCCASSKVVSVIRYRPLCLHQD